MNPRDRRLALGLLLATALVAVACATGGKQPTAAGPAATDSPSGNGGVGVVTGAAPTTAAPSPTLPEAATPAPTPKISFTIKILPPIILSEWPTPADCVTYNPDHATIKHSGSGTSELWQIVADGVALLAFKTALDGNQGLALAKAYRQQCFIGRGTEAVTDVATYWFDEVAPPDVPSPDCLFHDPSKLAVTASGSGWLVTAGSESIKYFSKQANANKLVLVLKHYNWHCYIGRDYSGADRANYITEWAISAG